MPNPARPTSPHLTIYKPQVSSVFSILHRITGVALYAGTVVLVAWLCTAAYAPSDYAAMHRCLASGVGQLLLLGWTFAFYYHLANGIRHLFWDIGKGFTLPEVDRSAWLALAFTVIMTLGTWGFAYAGIEQ